jgi:hypothetical protein
VKKLFENWRHYINEEEDMGDEVIEDPAVPGCPPGHVWDPTAPGRWDPGKPGDCVPDGEEDEEEYIA